jgi:urate oxidase/2-oxo-4-hydroxy-4-carboxy-5-ureidoimidazoline decarboxylase
MNNSQAVPKRNYYGKGDVIVYRLYREGPAGIRFFGANVKMLIYGDAFWQTYTTGDNTGLIATDSMKNFIQRETLNFSRRRSGILLPFPGREVSLDLSAGRGRAGISGGDSLSPSRQFQVAFAPGRKRSAPRGDRSGSRAGASRSWNPVRHRWLPAAASEGQRVSGFVRDEYTTLPDIHDRPLHMWLDLDWTYLDDGRRLQRRRRNEAGARSCESVFAGFESGSIQEIIYQIGQKMLADLPNYRGSAPRSE